MQGLDVCSPLQKRPRKEKDQCHENFCRCPRLLEHDGQVYPGDRLTANRSPFNAEGKKEKETALPVLSLMAEKPPLLRSRVGERTMLLDEEQALEGMITVSVETQGDLDNRWGQTDNRWGTSGFSVTKFFNSSRFDCFFCLQTRKVQSCDHLLDNTFGFRYLFDIEPIFYCVLSRKKGIVAS